MNEMPQEADDMAALADLALSLRQGAQGGANLAGLNEQFARAQKLANTQTAQPDRFNRTSGLAVINDLIGGVQGDNQLRELKPQREAARQSMAENKFALPLYQAGVNANKTAQAQQNFDSTAEARLAAAGTLAQAKEAQAQKMDARYQDKQAQTATAPTEYTDGKGGRIQLSRRNDGKWIDGKGQVMGSIDGLSEVPKATITSDGTSYKDKSANARAEKTINSLAAGDRIVGLYNDLSPKTLERIGSLRSRLIKIGANILPKDLTALVKTEMENDPQVKQYFSALANTAAIERHALFGGALTAYEGKSAEDFISFVVGLPPEEQISRMRNSIAKNKDALKSGDVIHGNGDTNYMNAYNAMNFDNINQLSESAPQEGSVNANRNAVPAYDDEAEEAAYQAWKQSQGAL